MQLIEAKRQLASHLDIDYDEIEYNGLFSETDLERSLNEAQKRIYDLHDWVPRETKASITNTEASSYSYPTNIKTGSIKFLTISGKPWRKLDYESYLDYLSNVEEGYAENDEEYYSEYGRTLYLNTEAYEATDTIEVLGDKGINKLENDTDLLFFSYGSNASASGTFTNSDATVTTATSFFTEDMVGGTIEVGGVLYTIDSFTSATEIELTETFGGTTTTTTFYVAYNDDTQNSGDDAIVLYAFGELLQSEKKQQAQKGIAMSQRAIEVANRVWQEQSRNRSRSESTTQKFKREDMFLQKPRNRRTRY